MKDGIYFDIVAIKNGNEYPIKRINIMETSKILTDSLMSGIGKVVGISEEAIEEYRENHDS